MSGEFGIAALLPVVEESKLDRGTAVTHVPLVTESQLNHKIVIRCNVVSSIRFYTLSIPE